MVATVQRHRAILGISAFYHDAAAALIVDGKVVAAAQEERFTRKKHDPSFPANAVAFCLEWGGYSPGELDAVAFYDKPLLKFERLLETHCAFAPRGLRQFITAIPVWVRQKLLLKDLIKRRLKEIGGAEPKKLLFPEHHLSHAASAFYPSPFEEAAILTVDGVGEWATASICHGRGNRIRVLKELMFPHSLGLLYSAFTYFLGFRVNSGEYKLMGLAPYGDWNAGRVQEFAEKIKRVLVRIFDDGSIWLDQRYFRYASGLVMIDERKWECIFGFPRRLPESEIEQHHCDLAMAVQKVTEESVLKMAEEAKRLTGSKNLCLAGGVALNCVANAKLLESGIFDGLWIQPAAGDAGGALGAALAAHHIYFGEPREKPPLPDGMEASLLGPAYSDLEIERVARKFKARYRIAASHQELVREAARLLASGKVVGWFQGRMEWGPRALGNRSILADPRSPQMQKKLNLKIKFRESFRPFAPSVLEEEAGNLFEGPTFSPYMLLVARVSETIRKPLPEGYSSLPLREKLYHIRSELPAITHVDMTARLQTVNRASNPLYWELIHEFGKVSGYPVVVNTSFNVRGEPIVCTPEDAYRCFMRTDMDFLVMGRLMFDKAEQPGDKLEVGEWGALALD